MLSLGDLLQAVDLAKFPADSVLGRTWTIAQLPYHFISVILQWRILSSLPVPKVGAAIVVVIWGLETKRLREGGWGKQIPALTIMSTRRRGSNFVGQLNHAGTVTPEKPF